MNIHRPEKNNKHSFLLQLMPGIAPLVLYIIADTLFGEKIGVIAALILGVCEFTIILIREKRSDLFVLADTGFIIALGALSLGFNTPLLVKLKPALFECIAAAFFLLIAVLPKNTAAKLLRRLLRTGDASINLRPGLCYLLAALCFIHATLVFYAALALSNFWWIMATGSFYFLPLLAIIPLAYQRLLRPAYLSFRYKDDEWFDIVTPEGKIIGKMPRTLCHRGPGLLHPVVHLFVINSEGCILLQKRSTTKSIQPGKWDTSVGGHVASGESVMSALHREAKEELDISGFTPLFAHRYLWEYEIESELVFSFVTRYDGEMQFNKDEIDEIAYFTIEQIESGELELTPNLKHEIVLVKLLFSNDAIRQQLNVAHNL